MTDSQTHTEEADETRRIGWDRIRRWALWGVLIFVVGAAIVRNLPSGSEDDSITPGGASPPPTSDASGPGPTDAATTTAPAGPLARYFSLDGSQLDGTTSLAGLFQSEIELPSRAFNQFTSTLGLPDRLDREDGRRIADWTLPGGATVQVIEAVSIMVFCGDNTIRGHVGDGVVLCLSTLEEANNAAADGIGDYPFVSDDSGAGAGNWMACDSTVLSENARLEFRVNATADSPGSSAAEASPGDIINGLLLINCTAE